MLNICSDLENFLQEAFVTKFEKLRFNFDEVKLVSNHATLDGKVVLKLCKDQDLRFNAPVIEVKDKIAYKSITLVHKATQNQIEIGF